MIENFDPHQDLPPIGATTYCTLVPVECGLCEQIIEARTVAWIDWGEQLPTHPRCWIGEQGWL